MSEATRGQVTSAMPYENAKLLAIIPTLSFMNPMCWIRFCIEEGRVLAWLRCSKGPKPNAAISAKA